MYLCISIPATEDYLYELGAVLNKVQKDEAAALAMATMKRQVDNLPVCCSDNTTILCSHFGHFINLRNSNYN